MTAASARVSRVGVVGSRAEEGGEADGWGSQRCG